MSKYTTQLRYLVEEGYDFGQNSYPIFEEAYRSTLNRNIINHYYTREIGLETAGLFRHYFISTMNEIMPYYNKLYLSERKNFDPLITQNYEETFKRVIENTSGAEGSSTQGGKNVYSDTPQGLLSINSIKDELYASNATFDETTNKSVNTGLSVGDEDYTKKFKGQDGNPAELIMKYREALINVDLMVIAELNDLFMGIY